jgi:hypothetical protein
MEMGKKCLGRVHSISFFFVVASNRHHSFIQREGTLCLCGVPKKFTSIQFARPIFRRIFLPPFNQFSLKWKGMGTASDPEKVAHSIELRQCTEAITAAKNGSLLKVVPGKAKRAARTIK